MSTLIPLAQLEQIQLVVNLPAHFDDNIPHPVLKIQRIRRQRYHAWRTNRGTPLVEWRPDFPIIAEAEGPFEGWTEQELDRFERSEWRTGVNMEHEYIHEGVWINQEIIATEDWDED
ncbi:hypothetical protein NX059_001358 [Plenodomus lindquistii]|nr:hypothetical protein NX059_001358 [Plenodomus lindquistii]